MIVPFCKIPNEGEEEIEMFRKVWKSGWVVQGAITQEFEEQFAEYVGAKHAVFVDSCTSALFLALKAQNIKRCLIGEYVSVPSLTFSATAENVYHAGSVPYFVDVDEKTFCMKKNYTLAIPVHLTGNRATVKGIIYDSAHRIERGDIKESDALWCYSFYATKNMTTIQGGMIALNDELTASWLRKARDHGISRGTTERYKDGKWKYEIEFVGWREKSDDVHAAIGLVQLEKLDNIQKDRYRIVQNYNAAFGLSRMGKHLYPILVKDRKKFMAYMREQGVQCSVHFLPLHLMPAYKNFPHEPLPNTEYLGKHLVSLPLYPSMKNEEIDYVCSRVLQSKQLLK